MKAFCDENRLKILAVLRNGEQCACKLLEHLDIGQPALSYHMKILIESGVVTGRACGKWIHYRLNEPGCKFARELMNETLCIPNYDEGTQCAGEACGCRNNSTRNGVQA